jgi:pyrimidine-nucleoside phosphorylase
VASILSKKLAMGIDFASVDIRAFPGGNFGDSLSEAQDNAWIFTETGKQLGIEVCTHISDGTQISQPYIGRSEALLALYEIFSGTENAWLREHYDTCKSISQRLATERLTNKDIASVFFDNVMHQGGSYESFESIYLHK